MAYVVMACIVMAYIVMASMECGLAGIECRAVDNLPAGCLDYRVQFYCADNGYTAPPRVLMRHVVIAVSQAPFVGAIGPLHASLLQHTLPPVQSVALRGVGEAAMQGRGRCSADGQDTCPFGCGGSCVCAPGWGSNDCSSFLLRTAVSAKSTDERGTRGQHVELRVGGLIQPCQRSSLPCDVVCEVSVLSGVGEGAFIEQIGGARPLPTSEDGFAGQVNGEKPLPTSTRVTISGANFDPVAGGATDGAVLVGVKDFEADGNRTFDVVVGPCSSEDPQYDGIAQNQHPDVTQIALVNAHVEFPVISAIAPGAAHNAGSGITVRGARFLQNSAIMYDGTDVADWGNTSNAFRWRFLRQTNTSHPLTRSEAEMIDALQALDCIGHGHTCHTYIGHTYTGHDYTGHNYVGHNYVGHNYVGHNYITRCRRWTRVRRTSK